MKTKPSLRSKRRPTLAGPAILLGFLALIPGTVLAQGPQKNPTSKIFVSDVSGNAQIDTGDNIQNLNKRSVYTAEGTVIETKAATNVKDKGKIFSSMVYSNGTGAYFDEDTKVELRRFQQEPFTPNRTDMDVEPSISQTHAFVARGTVGLCTSKLVAGSNMTYSTAQGSINIRGKKVVIEAGNGETKISMLEGDSTVKAGNLDMGGSVLHAGEQAIIRQGVGGQPNSIRVQRIPPTEAAALDDKVAQACMAKKTVYFEAKERAPTAAETKAADTTSTASTAETTSSSSTTAAATTDSTASGSTTASTTADTTKASTTNSSSSTATTSADTPTTGSTASSTTKPASSPSSSSSTASTTPVSSPSSAATTAFTPANSSSGSSVFTSTPANSPGSSNSFASAPASSPSSATTSVFTQSSSAITSTVFTSSTGASSTSSSTPFMPTPAIPSVVSSPFAPTPSSSTSSAISAFDNSSTASGGSTSASSSSTVTAFDGPAANSAVTTTPIRNTVQEIVAVPVIPVNIPVQYTVSPSRIVTTPGG